MKGQVLVLGKDLREKIRNTEELVLLLLLLLFAETLPSLTFLKFCRVFLAMERANKGSPKTSIHSSI